MNLFFNRIKGIIPIIVFILVWESASRLQLVNNLFIPPFSDVLLSIWNLATTGDLLVHICISLIRALFAFIIAAIVSIPLGFLLAGLNRNLQIAIEPIIDICSQVNPFVLFHLAILILGIGEITKIISIAWMCTWPIVFSTASGVKNVDNILIKSARSLGVNDFQLSIKVILPSALPSIFTGLKLSAGYSVFMLIAAEMMGASSGLGWLIINNQENYSITNIFSAVTVITFLGVIINILMEKLEKILVPYENKEHMNYIFGFFKREGA